MDIDLKKGRWSRYEHMLFLTALSHHGKNWKLMRKLIPTRSLPQIRSHAQKYFSHQQKEKPDQSHPRLYRIPGSDQQFANYFEFVKALRASPDVFSYFVAQSNYIMQQQLDVEFPLTGVKTEVKIE